jgi:hypothetical protein
MDITLNLSRDQSDRLELVTADLPTFMVRSSDAILWLSNIALEDPVEAQAPGFASCLELVGMAIQAIADRDGSAISEFDSILREGLGQSIRGERS